MPVSPLPSFIGLWTEGNFAMEHTQSPPTPDLDELDNEISDLLS